MSVHCQDTFSQRGLACLQYLWLVLLRCLYGKRAGKTSLFCPNACLHFHSIPWHLYRDIFVLRCYTPPVSLPASPVILDLGANIGVASLFFLQRYPCATLTSLEPNPEAFALLQTNLPPERYPSATLRTQCYAVSAQDGEVSFAVPLDNKTAVFASISGRNTMGLPVQTFRVPTIALGRLLTKHIDLMKVDIEGHEYEILQAQEIIPERVTVLIVEFHYIQENRETCAAILKSLMVERGYQARDERGAAVSIEEFCARQGNHILTFWSDEKHPKRLPQGEG